MGARLRDGLRHLHPQTVPAISPETQGETNPLPSAAPSPPPALAVSVRGRSGPSSACRALGGLIAVGARAQPLGTPPSTEDPMAAPTPGPRQDQGQRHPGPGPQLSSEWPPGWSWRLWAAPRSPSLSCLPGAQPGPRAASHVVQNLGLHLVLAPVRRLEVLFFVLRVLPGLVRQLLLPTVSLGRAGEESWGQGTRPCVPMRAPDGP